MLSQVLTVNQFCIDVYIIGTFGSLNFLQIAFIIAYFLAV
jgi:hypothetical protein